MTNYIGDDHKLLYRMLCVSPPLITYHDHLEDEGILGQDPEHMDDAGHHPGLHSRQTLGLGSVGSDRVEDVDEDEEQGDQQGHPT